MFLYNKTQGTLQRCMHGQPSNHNLLHGMLLFAMLQWHRSTPRKCDRSIAMLHGHHLIPRQHIVTCNAAAVSGHPHAHGVLHVLLVGQHQDGHIRQVLMRQQSKQLRL